MHPQAPDARLANYRLDRLLGTGGMGAVYLARDLTLERNVAIKFISPELAGDEAARRRLMREARAAAALDHPNICAVHEVILTDDGRACIVMAYVEGETLAEALRRGPLEPRQALGIAAELASALAAAHRRGIVHRDLKPQNVIVTPSGRAKLLDFGIARVLEPPTDAAETQTSLTGAGVVPGTPAYMSPEQIRQQPVDARSDLFSLGAVLFEALTGRRAFNGATVAEIYGQVLHEHPPAPSALRPELTLQHDELCRRLLAKHPADRLASADELGGALRVLLPDTAHDTGVSATHEPRHHRPVSSRWMLALAAPLIVAAIGVYSWTRPSSLATPPPAAEDWFNRGVQKIRDGSYHGGVLALRTAIAEFEAYPAAYARLAEAYSELDQGRDAQHALLRLAGLDLSRVGRDDRLRLDAVRALVTRDVLAAVAAYRELADRHPRDAGAWLDLGRAQEAAGELSEAMVSYVTARRIEPLNAAAHLRIAMLLKESGTRDDALAAFTRAEELYATDSNVEGQAETLLRRGAYLNAIGSYGGAREALTRAADLASAVNSRSHGIRVQLQLAAVTAAEGHFTGATALAERSVREAQDAGLDAIAAEGLTDLAGILMLRGQFEEADELIGRAMEVAASHDAQRTLTRAALNRASIRLSQRRPADALAVIDGIREIVVAQRFRRFEATALLIAARAGESLGTWAQVEADARAALGVAEALQDEGRVAQALGSLAAHARATGALPTALGYQERIESIHRGQAATGELPYDLTNRAELLTRLGRHEEAEAALQEVDEGIARGIESYVGRARRVHYLRALNAAGQDRLAVAADHAAAARDGPPDATGRAAAALSLYLEARLGRRSAPSEDMDRQPSPETVFWGLAARLARADTSGIVERVDRVLSEGEGPPSPEVTWRLAAIGAAAARRAGDASDAERLARRAREALGDLREAWGPEMRSYERRADLAWLRGEARLTTSDR